MATKFLPTHNYFLFDEQFFLWQWGASIWARFSPSLANIFKAAWEKHFLFSMDNPYSAHIRWYGHYIDDLLLLWSDADSMVEEFFGYINSMT